MRRRLRIRVAYSPDVEKRRQGERDGDVGDGSFRQASGASGGDPRRPHPRAAGRRGGCPRRPAGCDHAGREVNGRGDSDGHWQGPGAAEPHPIRLGGTVCPPGREAGSPEETRKPRRTGGKESSHRDAETVWGEPRETKRSRCSGAATHFNAKAPRRRGAGRKLFNITVSSCPCVKSIRKFVPFLRKRL